jgi:hypothetical protein
LSESLRAIEKLREEVLQMQAVDFRKYADIIVNLQMKNNMYSLIKYFDDDFLAHIRSRFDQDSGMAMVDVINRLFGKAIQLQSNGTLPGSEQGQAFAKEFWDMIIEFTGGEMNLLPKIIELAEKDANDDWLQMQKQANGFIEPALDIYFERLGISPLDGVSN